MALKAAMRALSTKFTLNMAAAEKGGNCRVLSTARVPPRYDGDGRGFDAEETRAIEGLYAVVIV